MSLRVFQYPPTHGVPNLSPFCCKLTTWLRMTGIEHEVVHVTDARRSPTKTIPWIVDGDEAIGDTSLIIEHLTRTRQIALDAELTSTQRATAHAVQRMLEEHAKWVTSYRLFVAEYGWAVTRSTMDAVPAVIRPLVASVFLRGRLRKQGWAQGLGRFDHDERMRRGCDDWTSIATLLGDQRWLLGDKPHTIDAIVFGFLASIVVPPIDDELRRHVRARPTLVAYVERVIETWFPELIARASESLPAADAR